MSKYSYEIIITPAAKKLTSEDAKEVLDVLLSGGKKNKNEHKSKKA